MWSIAEPIYNTVEEIGKKEGDFWLMHLFPTTLPNYTGDTKEDVAEYFKYRYLAYPLEKDGSHKKFDSKFINELWISKLNYTRILEGDKTALEILNTDTETNTDNHTLTRTTSDNDVTTLNLTEANNISNTGNTAKTLALKEVNSASSTLTDKVDSTITSTGSNIKDTTASNNDKVDSTNNDYDRTLSSDTPQSIVDASTTGNPTSINWKYATNLKDDIRKGTNSTTDVKTATGKETDTTTQSDKNIANNSSTDVASSTKDNTGTDTVVETKSGTVNKTNTGTDSKAKTGNLKDIDVVTSTKSAKHGSNADLIEKAYLLADRMNATQFLINRLEKYFLSTYEID